MSQHSSLKSGGGAVGAKRSVMKRFERVKLMKKRGQWKEGQSALGLPKTLPEGVMLFHAGTTSGANGVLRVDGGRVLTVTGVGATFREAQQLSRETASAIEFDGKLFRDDIGWR